MVDEQCAASHVAMDVQALAHVEVGQGVGILRHAEVGELCAEARAGVVVVLIVEYEVHGGVFRPPGSGVAEGERLFSVEPSACEVLDESVACVIVEREAVRQFLLDDRGVDESRHDGCCKHRSVRRARR